MKTQIASDPPTDAGGRHILVIGHGEEDVTFVRQALNSLDTQIDWVPDEEAAWSRLAARPYDLLVVLRPLPATDGLALCRRLRIADAHRPIMILATSHAATAAADVLAGFEAGADAYLVAPIPAEELHARVVALLRRHGAVDRPTTPDAADRPQPATVAPAAHAPTRRAGHARLGAGLIAARIALRAATTRLAPPTRILAAAALIATGVLGDRAVQAAHTPTATATTTGSATATTATRATTSGSLDAAMERAYAITSPSVVYIKSVGVGTGSGVIYDSTGDIVTNAHVVSGAQTVTVTLSNGKTYTARIVGTDTADDLAVIHVNARGLTAAHFASAGSYKVAQTVLAIGSPLGLQETVTSGVISALNRTVQESNGAYLPDAIQTSAPINSGNSGGALVDLAGEVVGIPTLKASDSSSGSAEGIGFAVPSSRVTYIAHQIIATGHVAHTGRAYLGVAATDVQQAQSQGQDPFRFGPGGGTTTATVAGALVQSVSGPAAQAGVQQGDVITAANGQPITSEDDLLAALAHSKPGQTMTLQLNRNGSTLTVHVHLGELPASAST
jgi:S1-C subfamily serine protease/DNA-binding response OmpR family regulator